LAALPASDVVAPPDVSATTGLSDEKIRRRAHAYGPNTIGSRRKISALIALAHQFQSPVVYLLAAAAAVALYFGELEEG
jgi:P-type Ca2+ transporter type 2C